MGASAGGASAAGASTSGAPEAGPSNADASSSPARREGDGASHFDRAARPATSPTTIRVHYPAGVGRSIALRASDAPLDWSTSRTADDAGDGTWTVTLPIAAHGGRPIELKPLLVTEDAQRWSKGSNYRVAPGSTVDIHPRFFGERGQVRTLFHDFYSHVLDDTRDIRVYLPPGYAENTEARYPVIYMHDGQNLFAPPGDPRSWRADRTLDHTIGSGGMREAIVVAIDHRDRLYELTPTASDEHPGSGGGDLYLRFIVEELMPEVESALRVQTGPAATAMAGSSLGGLLSLYAGIRYPEVFGAIAALSPSTWWDDRAIIERARAAAQSGALTARLYLDSGDSGDSDDDVDNTRALAKAIAAAGRARGPDFVHRVDHGAAHTEAAWGGRLGDVLGFLAR